MTDRPTRPRLRAIRGKPFGESPRRPKKPDVFAKETELTKPRPARPATTAKKPATAPIVEPRAALLHLALEKDGHHRKWFIGILGMEWTYTAIYDIDWTPHIFAPLTLAEAKGWVVEYLQLVAQSEAQGWMPARLRRCGWSGLSDPGQRIVPPDSAA